MNPNMHDVYHFPKNLSLYIVLHSIYILASIKMIINQRLIILYWNNKTASVHVYNLD